MVTVDTSKLGSTVMETMLKEVSDFCQPRRMKDWTKTTKQQVNIYLSTANRLGYCHLTM